MLLSDSENKENISGTWKKQTETYRIGSACTSFSLGAVRTTSLVSKSRTREIVAIARGNEIDAHRHISVRVTYPCPCTRDVIIVHTVT